MLIQEYATLGGTPTKMVERIHANPSRSFTELQLGLNWADYVAELEICKVATKVEYRNRQHGARISEQEAEGIRRECREVRCKARTVSPAAMMGVDHRPLATTLARRVIEGAFQVKAVADTTCGV